MARHARLDGPPTARPKDTTQATTQATTEPATAGDSGELGRAARGGAVTLLGSAASAVAGFTFNLMLARLLGAEGAGVVLQAVAAFTIALALAKLGLDTTAVWMLPRLVRTDRSRLRATTVGILLPALIAPLLVSCGWFLYRAVAPSGGGGGAVQAAMSVVALFLPAATVMTVALAATRAFGGVVPFNGIGNVAVPMMRPVGLALVVAVGGGTLAAAASWSAPWLVGMVLALLVLARMLRRTTKTAGGAWLPDRQLVRQIFAYSLPRMLMAGLEQTVIWLDVILVGVMLGSTQAGIYGSAARFVAAGVIVLTALRIVVAPRFSALLAERRVAEVEELYSVTARWVLLFGAPIYLMLAVFAPTVLGWLGPGFRDGVPSMVILSLGSILLLAAGNVQSLLLMSGRSSWGAFNKSVVVLFNVVGNLVLVPRVGIEGAAATWAVSMALDTSLAAWQVHRATGIALAARSVALTALAVSACVAVPSLLVIRVAGQGSLQLLVSAALGGVVLLGYCLLDRRRLRLDELVRMGRR